MRIGVFGGSFDPVHYGHLLLADCCREACRLDQVWFIPAAQSPHKRDATPTPGVQRLEMLQLAVAGDPGFIVSSVEIDRGGISYTVDTLEQLHRDRPSDELFLLMGADTLDDLPRWRQPQRICELTLPVVVHRGGAPEPNWEALRALTTPDRFQSSRALSVEMPVHAVSSREIRARVAQGRSIRFRTPRAVEKYIETHALYR